MEDHKPAPHPGAYIKTKIITQCGSVTKAAQLLGVGRPALSNLLNGKASLSTDMAKRLEMTFDYSSKDLLTMQAEYDEAQAASTGAPSNTRVYAPPFLAIKANDIELWASPAIQARSRFSVFLRTLVHSTGSSLTKVDFPGNDDAERPGWDGFVEAGSGTAWIPQGSSGWEFGVNEDIKGKADGDFDKSVKATNAKKRSEIAFVFVTPRRWSAKANWVSSQKGKELWKDVRAYDASDLEQWLEQSLVAQTWFANETNRPAKDVRSLDRCWSDWANVTKPPLSAKLFDSAIETAKLKMASYLSKPSEGPMLIGADSTEEALAFISQFFSENGGEDLAHYRDKVLVFDKVETLPELAQGAKSFISVIHNREVEREFAPFAASMHSIVIYPRNAPAFARSSPTITLELASYKTFNNGLEEMGKSPDEISRLASESGRSLTVLRRTLATTVPAVQIPEWANDHQTKIRLIPFLFVGAWDNKNEMDQLGVEQLADGHAYSELEREFQRIIQHNDSPFWAAGKIRGVVSKIDLLYILSSVVTKEDLNRYFEVARMVLDEDNPALDLEEDKRWAASIYGKTRDFSSIFRAGIAETLVLLGVHGNHLFMVRFGFNVEVEVARIVRELLPTPLTTRKLEANDRELPSYAEATPDTFLSILEQDLKSDNPAVLGLLRPASVGPFSHSSRTGLLWALEGLSWNPETLPRAALILARLAQIELTDNWMNKPINSLYAIFRAWMPQTSVNLEARISLVKKIAKEFPEVGWNICVDQFRTGTQLGHRNHKPKWRADGSGFGEPLSTSDPVNTFVSAMVNFALTRKEYSLSMLRDLVKRLEGLDDSEKESVWSLIENWTNNEASDTDKALLRDKVREVMSRRANKGLKAKSLEHAAKVAYQELEPTDLIIKHSWLFREDWIEVPVDGIEDAGDVDFNNHQQRSKNLRIAALQEVFKAKGSPGLIELAAQGNAALILGSICASAVLTDEELQGFIKIALESILADQEKSHSQKLLIKGAISAISDESKLKFLLKNMTAHLDENEKIALLLLAPFRNNIWTLVDELSEAGQKKYWDQIEPEWIHVSDEENNEGVHRLMKAGRYLAAFSCIRLLPEKLDADVLYRLLSEIAKGSNDKPGSYRLDHHSVEKAFRHINSSNTLTLEEKASLEFGYIEILSPHFAGQENNAIPNLEHYIELHPEIYVQAILWTFKREDGPVEPTKSQVPKELVEDLAKRSEHLLKSLKRIPGHNDLGELDAICLNKWISSVRKACKEISLEEDADSCIGELLSSSPSDADNIWPCKVVRDVLEDIQSEGIMQGMCMGVYNSRGATLRSRSEGGVQERKLAEKYRRFGQATSSPHPYVATKLLFEIADYYESLAIREDTRVCLRSRLD